MLIGTAENTLDDKGRLTLSKVWHLELASGFFMTRGFDPCLFIFKVTTFESIVRELVEREIASSDVRAFARLLAAYAEQGKLDKQGRIGIPPHLRQFAGVDDQVTVVGVFNRLELWNPKKFAEINAQSEANAAQVAEQYSNLIHENIRIEK